MPPQRSDLVLSSYIPHGELDVLVLDSLNVEAWQEREVLDSMAWLLAQPRMSRIQTDCRDGGNDFTEFQLVEDSCFSCRIETDHQNAHLLFAPELIEQFRERETHDGG